MPGKDITKIETKSFVSMEFFDEARAEVRVSLVLERVLGPEKSLEIVRKKISFALAEEIIKNIKITRTEMDNDPTLTALYSLSVFIGNKKRVQDNIKIIPKGMRITVLG